MLTRKRFILLSGLLFALLGCATSYSMQQRATGAVAIPAECPDLSGRYTIQGEDGQVHIYIEQTHCDRVTIRRESGYLGTITSEKHVLKLDGTVQPDSRWFGSSDQYKSSAKFVKRTLQIEATAKPGSTLKIIYSLTPHGDLVEDSLLNGKRSGGPIVAKRQK